MQAKVNKSYNLHAQFRLLISFIVQESQQLIHLQHIANCKNTMFALVLKHVHIKNIVIFTSSCPDTITLPSVLGCSNTMLPLSPERM